MFFFLQEIGEKLRKITKTKKNWNFFEEKLGKMEENGRK